jgi:seryl-tRNA synthetase
MHDIKWIRDNPAAFDRALARRGLSPEAGKLIELDERRRAAIGKAEAAQARRNAASREIGAAKKSNEEETAQKLLAEVAALKSAIPALEAEERKLSRELEEALARIPNIPLDEVPDGNDASGNVEHHHFGAKRDYGFVPKQHFDLGEALGQMDFETAAKLSGARFVVLKNGLARLERALGQFMLDLHTGEHGYAEVNPPLLVRDEVMFGTAQLPKFADDQFSAWREASLRERVDRAIESDRRLHMEKNPDGGVDGYADAAGESKSERLWLIPTAEVSLTNLVRESIIDEAALPMRLTALTACFRAEAGASGKDTRGMIRQHQFQKVELVKFTRPEDSYAEHERLTRDAERVLEALDLPYRRMLLCTADMGFSSAKTYDLEVWLPGQQTYREISSCSNFESFQARRANIKFKPAGSNKAEFLHTLNGSGLAVGRTYLAILENYQQADGSVRIPSALQPYMNGETVITPQRVRGIEKEQKHE